MSNPRGATGRRRGHHTLHACWYPEVFAKRPKNPRIKWVVLNADGKPLFKSASLAECQRYAHPDLLGGTVARDET